MEFHCSDPAIVERGLNGAVAAGPRGGEGAARLVARRMGKRRGRDEEESAGGGREELVDIIEH